MSKEQAAPRETAKQYLQRNNLHLLFEHMAYKVLSERPEDPNRAIFDYIGAKIGVDTKAIKSKPAEAPSHKVVFIIGGPGSGKGTQCEKLGTDGYCTYVSTGDLLRREQELDTPEGKQIKEIMKSGQLVPKAMVLKVLKGWIAKQPKGTTILLDGFPREMGQALSFETDIQPCDFAICFNCPDDVLEKRLLQRAATSGRADDNLATIKNRLKVFHDETAPAIEYYKALNKLHEIDANRDIAMIYEDLKKLFVKEEAPASAKAPEAAAGQEEEEL